MAFGCSLIDPKRQNDLTFLQPIHFDFSLPDELAQSGVEATALTPLHQKPFPMLNRLLTHLSILLIAAPMSLGQEARPRPSAPESLAAGDWQAIQTAHQVAERQAYSSGKVIHARNTRQGWLVSFDGKGFSVNPRSHAWTWGLQLHSYGFDQAVKHIEGQASATIDGDTVRYDWNANVQEWCINGASGLEHGYTIQERPLRGTAVDTPLVFTLKVRGNLTPEIMGHGNGLRFLNAQGTSTLTYTGLHVFDADGITQQAKFIEADSGVRISISESGATYPLTIDPIAQQTYLKASNTNSRDEFGTAVAISGDVVAVGAYREDSNATGVNGDQLDNSMASAGAVYVFERIGGTWSQTAYLKSSNTASGQAFGDSVSVSGTTVVVGCVGDSSDADGVNGNHNDSSAPYSGAAYVFERIGGAWTQQAYIKSSNSDTGDGFGGAVAISGDFLVVGALGESSHATGIDGDQTDNSLTYSGAAYLFERSGANWSQLAYLKASNTDAWDKFGGAVAISGTRFLVGAEDEGSSATGINGDQNNNNRPESGAVYAFAIHSGVVTQEAYLKADESLTWLHLGSALAIDSDTLVVSSASKAHVFDWSAAGWLSTAQLGAPNFSGQGIVSVGISGDHIFLGNPYDGVKANGVNDFTQEGFGFYVGGVYHYQRIAGTWQQQEYLKALHAREWRQFGKSIGVSGELAVIGMPGDYSNATGVDGDQAIGGAQESGAAFIFDLSASQTNYCGTAVPNSSGLPGRMSMSGSFAVADNAFTLHATDLPTGQFGYFLNSMGQGIVMKPGGSQGDLCLGGGAAMGRHNRAGEVGFSGATGQISLTLDLANMPAPGGATVVMAGEQWNFQCWFRDSNPGSTSNFTDGLWVEFE